MTMTILCATKTPQEVKREFKIQIKNENERDRGIQTQTRDEKTAKKLNESKQ